MRLTLYCFPSVIVVTGLRMASLQNAVSPDFTYSQSYLSLLSASGCMTGIICCASPSISVLLRDAIVITQRWHRDRRDRATKALQNLEEGLKSRTDEDLNREEGQSKHDTARYGQGPDHTPRNVVNEGTISGTDNNNPETGNRQLEVEKHDILTDSTARECPSQAAGDGFSKGAIAVTDFVGTDANQIKLVRQGQLIYVYERRSPCWLLAENLVTEDVGLIPERCVRFFQ